MPERGVGQHLPVLPDEDLLVIPAQANAHVLLHVQSVGLFGENVGADGLGGMHDLGKAIIVIRSFDLQRVEVAEGLGRSWNSREEHGGKELPRRFDAGNAGRVLHKLAGATRPKSAG